jgi:hypothetical protein
VSAFVADLSRLGIDLVDLSADEAATVLDTLDAWLATF